MGAARFCTFVTSLTDKQLDTTGNDSLPASSYFLTDDCKIYKRIECDNDSLSMQQDLDAFVEGCNINGLELSLSKYRHLRFTCYIIQNTLAITSTKRLSKGYL